MAIPQSTNVFVNVFAFKQALIRRGDHILEIASTGNCDFVHDLRF